MSKPLPTVQQAPQTTRPAQKRRSTHDARRRSSSTSEQSRPSAAGEREKERKRTELKGLKTEASCGFV